MLCQSQQTNGVIYIRQTDKQICKDIWKWPGRKHYCVALKTYKQNEVFYFCERKHIDKGPEGEGGRVEVLNLVLADRVERSLPVDLELGLAEPWDLHHHVERLQEKKMSLSRIFLRMIIVVRWRANPLPTYMRQILIMRV